MFRATAEFGLVLPIRAAYPAPCTLQASAETNDQALPVILKHT
jgi:hypothetical protein